MTKTAWAHLPNAKHIDAVLADVRKRPEAWAAVVGATQARPRADAWDAAEWMLGGDKWTDLWSLGWGKGQYAVRHGVNVAAWGSNIKGAHGVTRTDRIAVARAAARSTVVDAAIALSTWDSAADLLVCTPDVLRTMIDLAEPPVCHQAALLLPYAIVRFGP